MAGALGSGFGSMIAWWSDMKMLTGPCTSFPSQVPRFVNMEAVFALR